MFYKIITAFLSLAVVLAACNKTGNRSSSSKSVKWNILFNGSDLSKWRGYKKDSVPAGWEIINKELVLTKKEVGDIITKDVFQDFELELEWKISEGGNSGIFFYVMEDTQYNNTFSTGPEMQILDDEKHPDANNGVNGNRKAGSLYDIIPSSQKANPAGEWNKVRISINKGQAEFWLNENKAVDFEMWSENWNNLVAKSKFKDWRGFGAYKKGHIGLQDHGDKVFFRNIRIREL